MSETLYGGCAAVDITPPSGFPRYYWGCRSAPGERGPLPLLARATVFGHDETRIAIVSLDLLSISRSLACQIETRIDEVCGIAGAAVILNCSHTHEGPVFVDWDDTPIAQDYDQLLVGAVVTCVEHAVRDLEPVELGYRRVECDELNRNRRRKDEYVDHGLTVIRVMRCDLTIKSVLWHFATHPVANIGSERMWSPDFPGVCNDIIESRYPTAQCQFLQGACGDVFPLDWYFGQPDPSPPNGVQTEQWIGARLADEIERALSMITTIQGGVLTLSALCVEIPLKRRRMSWSIAEAEALCQELESRLSDVPLEPWGPDDHVVNMAQRHEDVYAVIGARSAVELTRMQEQPVRCRLAVVQLGPMRFATVPGELFSEPGAVVRDHLEGSTTLLSGCSNGYIWYIPAKRDMDEVASWSLAEFVNQTDNRWAYGATITTHVDSAAADSVVAALCKMLDATLPSELIL